MDASANGVRLGVNIAASGVNVATANSARDLLLYSLSRFYSDPANMARVLPYITCSSGISLRLIDWYVTNYAKRHNDVLHKNDGSEHFNVHINYRAQLKAYSKQQFDPFRRRDRILFQYDHDKTIETTVGQLNFFRWMIQHGLLEHIARIAVHIEQDMLAAQRPSGGGGSSGGSDDDEIHDANAKPSPNNSSAFATDGAIAGTNGNGTGIVTPTTKMVARRPRTVVSGSGQAPGAEGQDNKGLLVNDNVDANANDANSSGNKRPAVHGKVGSGGDASLCRASKNMTRLTGMRTVSFS